MVEPNTRFLRAGNKEDIGIVHHDNSTSSGTRDQRIEWEELGKLGSGGQGAVFRVADVHTGDHYGLKIVPYKVLPYYSIKTVDDFKDHVEKEIELVKKVAHPNVVPYLHHQCGKDGKTVEIFMPVYEGSLRDRIEGIRALQEDGREVPMEWARDMLVQILTALNHIHSHQKIHRDIKPDNILSRGDNWVLADFGIAKPINTSGSRDTKIGTDMYGPPEFFNREQQMPAYDIYGLGLCLLECFTQLIDEETRNETETERYIRLRRLMCQYAPDLENMLCEFYTERPSARKLLGKLDSFPTCVPLTSRWHRPGNTTTSLQTIHNIQEGGQEGEAAIEVDCQPYAMSWEQTVVKIPSQQLCEHTGFGTVQVQTIVVSQRKKQWWDLSPGGPSEISTSTPKSSTQPPEPLQAAPQLNTVPGYEPGQRQGATNTRASLRLRGNSPETSTVRTCPKRPRSPASLGTPRRTKRNKTVPGGE